MQEGRNEYVRVALLVLALTVFIVMVARKPTTHERLIEGTLLVCLTAATGLISHGLSVPPNKENQAKRIEVGDGSNNADH